jgi:hypothetical protein
MQERFCTCGHKVFVAYLITSRGIYHLFRTSARMRELMRCPCCGRPINIDELG